MIRFAIAVLAIVGLVSLFTSGVSAAAAGASFLLLFPLLILAKILLFGLFLGFVGRGFGRRGPYRPGPWGWRDRPGQTRDEAPSKEDDFEEWHRMAHAREEVDRWAEGVE